MHAKIACMWMWYPGFILKKFIFLLFRIYFIFTISWFYMLELISDHISFLQLDNLQLEMEVSSTGNWHTVWGGGPGALKLFFDGGVPHETLKWGS